MFQRDQIESLLKLNGLSTSASDAEIKSILISARWQQKDVEAAILVLREDPESHMTHMDSLHKVFRSDERLSPETISELLGIEMNITSEDIEVQRKNAKQMLSTSQMMQITIIALALSLIFVFAAMWYLKIGLFYQSLL
ncbi:MAG: hypothetical protein ACI92I_000713 [Acidimicrobiales bacterium]|jgi:hypothetical protein